MGEVNVNAETRYNIHVHQALKEIENARIALIEAERRLDNCNRVYKDARARYDSATDSMDKLLGEFRALAPQGTHWQKWGMNGSK